jgi:hypothetical protein
MSAKDDERIRALLAPLNRIDGVKRSGQKATMRRRLTAAAVGVVTLIAASAAIAGGLGVFSGATTSEVAACTPSMTAVTTSVGGQVLTGETNGGIHCLSYVDRNGTSVSTAGALGGTPLGDILALKALDTSSKQYVIAAVVPDGYDTLATGARITPIENHAFAIDASDVSAVAVLTGSSGKMTVNLAKLATSDTIPPPSK